MGRPQRRRRPSISDLRSESRKGRFHLSAQLEFVEHRSRVLTLVRNGATAEQAAGVLNDEGVNITARDVTTMVRGYLDRIHTEDALTIEQMRVLENERLDSLWRQLMAQSRNPDGTPNLKIIDRLTRLSERRAKMNGFEAAQRHEHVVRGSLTALGIEADHLDRAQRAWLEVGGGDADVVDAAFEELPPDAR